MTVVRVVPEPVLCAPGKREEIRCFSEDRPHRHQRRPRLPECLDTSRVIRIITVQNRYERTRVD